jgi:RNA processing factor Prp31
MVLIYINQPSSRIIYLSKIVRGLRKNAIMSRNLLSLLLGSTLVLLSNLGFSAEEARQRSQAQMQTNTPIYGSQLMTVRERNEYRARIRSATTEKERKMIQAEHHAHMQARAKERGLTLPDEVPEHALGAG